MVAAGIKETAVSVVHGDINLWLSIPISRLISRSRLEGAWLEFPKRPIHLLFPLKGCGVKGSGIKAHSAAIL